MSATGDVNADHAADGDGTETAAQGTTHGDRPVDLMPNLGEVDSWAVDLPYSQIPGTGEWEGEGRGGDLRPDGVHLGLTGRDTWDGSLFYLNNNDNVPRRRATVTMWVKPMWHHGTYLEASIPAGYLDSHYSYVKALPQASDTPDLADAKRNEALDERGSTVFMHDYPQDFGTPATLWPCEFQHYSGRTSRSGEGYIRERFEHEFFNMGDPGTDMGAKALTFRKNGDWQNTMGDMDECLGWGAGDLLDGGSGYGTWSYAGPGSGSSPVSALHFELEPEGNDFISWMPGWLYPDSRPSYQMCPFRWFFVGVSWNQDYTGGFPASQIPSSSKASERQAHGMRWHAPNRTFSGGQPTEPMIEERRVVPDNPDPYTFDQHWNKVDDGAIMPWNQGSHKDRTRTMNLLLVASGRMFCDTMRTWERMPSLTLNDDGTTNDWSMIDSSLPGAVDPVFPQGHLHLSGGTVSVNWDGVASPPSFSGYDLEDWAFENYGTRYFNWGSGSVNKSWPIGVRGDPTFGQGFGINRPVDAAGGHVYRRLYSGTYATIDEFCVEDWRDITTHSGFRWPYERRHIGRYYYGTGGGAARFTSQSLYESEAMQSYSFANAEEGNEEIELGTVRWTVFTPYFCLDLPGLGRSDPFEFPYDEYFADPHGSSRHESTHRTNPNRLAHKHVRESSQRGVKVYVAGYEFEDPEAWAPVLDGAGPEHLRTTASDLRYEVVFDLPEALANKHTRGAILLDTPVFDDITITYMRRPRVLQWREVSE
jgi:hypothetical protein